MNTPEWAVKAADELLLAVMSTLLIRSSQGEARALYATRDNLAAIIASYAPNGPMEGDVIKALRAVSAAFDGEDCVNGNQDRAMSLVIETLAKLDAQKTKNKQDQ